MPSLGIETRVRTPKNGIPWATGALLQQALKAGAPTWVETLRGFHAECLAVILESRLWRKRNETSEQMRRRVLAETSLYIEECLKHPELAPRIPAIPAGSGRFPPSMTHSFWDSILFG